MTSWNVIANPAKGAIKAITPVSGTTADGYAEVIDIDVRWISDTVLTIANTAAVNGLIYKVDVYNDYANGTAFKTFENTVVLSDSDQVILVRHARVKVSVKAASAGNQTTYQVDCIAGRG
jgi:hypothetical protein